MGQTIHNYESIRNNLRSYDILRCIPRNLLYRIFVGHNAMLYRDRKTDTIHVFESTLANKRWTGKTGVQLIPLGLWLQHYRGKVEVLKFVPTYRDKLNETVRNVVLARTIKKYRGTSYPNLKKRAGRWELLKAWLDVCFLTRNKPDDEFIYCTELCAIALKRAKYLSEMCNTEEFVPGDLRPHGKFHRRLINCKYVPVGRLK
jgi:hypothetical protein